MEIVSVSVSSTIVEQGKKKDTEKEKVGGRPAKLNKKKGIRDLEQDKKPKETFFWWKKNMKIL